MSPQLKSQIGTILCRGVVPAWVATGAIVKLSEATSKLLPEKTILAIGKALSMDLMILLASLIAIEFVCIIVMVLLQKYARATAIFILSVFCLVLLGEMARGNFISCGCLGDISIPPWAMFIADGALLFGVFFFRPEHKIASGLPRWPIPLAVVLSLAAIGLSFGVIISEGQAPKPPRPAQNGNTQTSPENGVTPKPPEPVANEYVITFSPDNPTINLNPKPLKGTWYIDDINKLIGKPWRKLEIFQFMPKWPSNMDEGKHYVVFYSRTCDHCQEMFDYDLTDPQLAAIVTAVEIPYAKDLMSSDHDWPMPETECELLSLPLGCDWVVTPPITFRVEDGIVTCAVEGGHSVCMELGPEDH